ncbi:MAG: HDOD domain-containing protein [Calditrichaeota bacterium]|nr:MAG: HDOD domain-containing protein [Calditrichota bacterium]
MRNRAANYIPELKGDLLNEIIEVTRDFTAPPLILTRILELTSEPNVPIEKIADVLSSDVATAAKILKLSNSAFYGRSRNISSIREAIVLLGIHTVRSLVVASSTHSLYSSSTMLRDLKRSMWEHSLAAAIFCKMMARQQRTFPPEEAFLAGLLHDVGKLVLLERFPDKYSEILTQNDITTAAALDLEKQLFQFTHQDVGAALVDGWLLPDVLVGAIGQHHESNDLHQLSGLTAIADAVVSMNGHNILEPDAAQKKSIEDLELDELVAQFEDEFSEQSRLFE